VGAGVVVVRTRVYFQGFAKNKSNGYYSYVEMVSAKQRLQAQQEHRRRNHEQ
jgi:coenzyme F420-reducing hydrogenase beta subunit